MMEQPSTTDELLMTGAGLDNTPSINTEVGLGENLPDRAILDEQASPVQTLAALTSEVRDQEELERDVAHQADQLFAEEADKHDERRIERVNTEKGKLLEQERKLLQRLNQPSGPATRSRLQAEVETVREKVVALDHDIDQIRHRMAERRKLDEAVLQGSQRTTGNQRVPNESQRDFLIRTGKITPFAAKARNAPARPESTLQDVMLDVEEGVVYQGEEAEIQVPQHTCEPLSHQNLRLPGFAVNKTLSTALGRPAKRRRIGNNITASENAIKPSLNPPAQALEDGHLPVLHDSARDEAVSAEASAAEDGEYVTNDDAESPSSGRRNQKSRSKRELSEEAASESQEAQEVDLSGIDDGNEKLYQARLRNWVERRSQARDAAKQPQNEIQNETVVHLGDLNAEVDEWYKPHPTVPDTDVHAGIKIPGDIYPSLFEYQKTGVQWLCELYSQHAGGIVGDEMGLGKTIQAISFLAGLHYSKRLTKPILVVAPATVLKQWVNEFHRWWPPLRVSILHTSGSGMLNVRGESQMEEDVGRRSDRPSGRQTKAQKSAARIVRTVLAKGHVLVTTYAGLQTYSKLLLPMEWDYALLDEGHKIRNPNAAITIFCKQLRTSNRIILSGTPMQNNLTELWSLLDFVFPMRLGTLLDFKNQFEAPIKIGGYANASNLEVQTARECAARLKDAIDPFLLQRLKVDVAADLPKKSELVLTCKLTKAQRDAYEQYIDSDDVRKIMNGDVRAFAGISSLRKICNHPDLVDRAILKTRAGYHYGNPAKSGKMLVVRNLLELWKRGGHKTLLFAQQKIMLDILEKYVRSIAGIQYRRMDGDTPIEKRQAMVDEFNQTPELDVFLLTTKVGGLGINLTGADRVIIFDPDWNPATDTQARERAWRLGQKREVIIYRLMTAGTIEEKIYHRQLFKQFLAIKILKDPSQRRTFPMKDLHDLFSYGAGDSSGTETGKLFAGTETMLRADPHVPVPSALEHIGWGGASPPPATAAAPASVDDVEHMDGVAGVQKYLNGEEGEDSTTEEKRLMERMLANSGVQSSLEHDDILHGRKKLQADPEVTAREAKRFADASARQLARAAIVARNVPIGTVTWTGQVGTTGRPQSHHPTPQQAGNTARTARVNQGGSEGNGRTVEKPDFTRLIRSFFNVHQGQVRTKMVIDHFNPMVLNKSALQAEFMELLKKMAAFQRGGRLRGTWTLRDEYR